MRPGAASVPARRPAPGRCPVRPARQRWAGWPPGPARRPPTWPRPGQPPARCPRRLPRCLLAPERPAQSCPARCRPGRRARSGAATAGATRPSAAWPRVAQCWPGRRLAYRMSSAVRCPPGRPPGARTRGDGARRRTGWAHCPSPTFRTAPGHGTSPADRAGCTGGRDRLAAAAYSALPAIACQAARVCRITANVICCHSLLPVTEPRPVPADSPHYPTIGPQQY
jgi:hypothetical protein